MRIFKKEKRVVGLAMDYLEALEACLGHARDALEHYITGDLDKAKEDAKNADDAESKADDLRHEIAEGLYAGAFLPAIRGDVYGLIESVDHVVNGAEACADFFLMQRPDIPADLREPFSEIAGESFKMAKPLAKALSTYFKPKGKAKEIRERVKKVSDQESVVDAKEWALSRAIFRSSLDLSQKMHLQAALDRIADVADRAEDAAERVELVSLKSIA